jgi:hypothetical protein
VMNSSQDEYKPILQTSAGKRLRIMLAHDRGTEHSWKSVLKPESNL